MKTIKYFSILLVVLTVFSGCKQKEESSFSSSTDQEKVVFASENPLLGETNFSLEKKLCISPRNLPLKKPPRFGMFDRAMDGSIYIVDINSYSVLKFNRNGKFLFKTGRRGAGPGEFRFITGLKAVPEGIWVWSLYKAVLFDAEGKLKAEISFKKSHLKEIIDSDNFLALSNIPSKEKTGRPLQRLAIVSREGVEKRILLESTNTGPLIIRTEKIAMAFGISGVTPFLTVAVDREAGRIYAADEAEYKVFVFDLKGNNLFTIVKRSSPTPIKKSDVEKILSSFRTKLSPPVKKLLKKNLPPYFCEIRALRPAPFGYLIVSRTTGFDSYENHLFSPDGKYLWKIKPLKTLRRWKLFSDGVIGAIIEEDQNLYCLFEVKNFQQLFKKR